MNQNTKDIKREKPKLKTVLLQGKLSLLKLKDSYERELSITHLETFLSQYQIKSLIGFTLYLSEIWKELSTHSENKKKGINRISFTRYFPLPGLINIRLFNIFDMNKNNYLSPREFIEGMTVLFSESLNKLIKFTFCFYDFDNDGYINRDDIRIVLSYIPILYDFEEMVICNEELYNSLNDIFGKKEKMDLSQFNYSIIDEENYELIIPIISFFYERKPFDNEEIDLFYQNYINNSKGNIYEIDGIVNIEKIEDLKDNNKDDLKSNLIKDSKVKSPQKIKGEYPKDFPILNIEENKCFSNKELIKVDNISNENTKNVTKKHSTPTLQNQIGEKLKLMATSAGFLKIRKTIPTIINSCKLLKNFEIENLIQNKNENDNQNESFFNSEDEFEDDEYDELKFNGQLNLNKNKKNRINEDNQYESYLYKLTSSSHKLKKIYFRLYNKDLFYFKTKKSKYHQGMHNLNGYFLEINEENNIETINNKQYYFFTLINPKIKNHKYFTDDIEIYENWINILKSITNYEKIEDLYSIKDEIGHGKFSKVYLAKEKKTKRKVAIKRIEKENLSQNDLDLIKTEIDILKVCQHPNIIKLYNIIETSKTIEIIMEYCPGGNLYYYLLKRKFNIKEEEIVKIIHKISTAVFTMHNLGIIHRDLKLSNIVMTDTTSFADIRILDFGLSKILGPGEKCNESYGTPGYAAPEVIRQNKYDFKADIWSIGVITYFLFSSKLPFDYVNKGNGKKDFIKNTLEDEVKFTGKEWDNVSKEGIKFIMDLMNKNVNERIDIKKVLEHEWIKKYYNDNVKDRKLSKKTYGYRGSDFRMYASIMKNKIEKVDVTNRKNNSNSQNNMIIVRKNSD